MAEIKKYHKQMQIGAQVKYHMKFDTDMNAFKV
jgi:hypothetical protein